MISRRSSTPTTQSNVVLELQTNKKRNSLVRAKINEFKSKKSKDFVEDQTFYRSYNRREHRNQTKLTISLIIILCTLLICYFPSFLFEESLIDAIFGEFKFDLTERSAKLLKIKGLGNRISLALIYVNCSCNFLIYCISNERFKRSLLSLLKKFSRNESA